MDIKVLREKNIEDLEPKELMALVLDIKDKIERIIDPDAFEEYDNLTPTERELTEENQKLRRAEANRKATAIIRLLI